MLRFRLHHHFDEMRGAVICSPRLALAMIAIVASTSAAIDVPLGHQCRPVDLRNGLQLPGVSQSFHGNAQAICRQLFSTPDSVLDKVYAQAAGPSSIKGHMIAGCSAGCMIGDGRGSEMQRNRNMWLGKCFTDFEIDQGTPRHVENIMRPRAMAVDWEARGSVGFGVKVLPGEVEPAPSWVGEGEALAFEYNNIPVMDVTRLQPFINYANFRDEMREVSPGVWLGKMWIKPNTLPNPGPDPMPVGYFALFQTCTSSGEYTSAPGEMDLTFSPVSEVVL